MRQVTIKRGQKWRRIRDGRVIEIESALPDLGGYIDVVWRGIDKPGRGAIYETNFRKRYELVPDAPR